MGSSGGEISEIGELAVRLCNDSGHFIAESQIQSQIRFPAPVVLDISAKDTLAEVAGRQRASNSPLKFAGLVLQKRRQVVKKPDPIWIRECCHLEQHALEGPSEFHIMFAACEEGIVVPLKGIPAV